MSGTCADPGETRNDPDSPPPLHLADIDSDQGICAAHLEDEAAVLVVFWHRVASVAVRGIPGTIAFAKIESALGALPTAIRPHAFACPCHAGQALPTVAASLDDRWQPLISVVAIVPMMPPVVSRRSV